MRRLDAGGTWIDRSRPVGFTFDGVGYQGFAGDTLASALWASGVVGGFRSPIAGRPRGIMADGPEEPNAFVAVLEPWVDLIAPATTVPLTHGLVAASRTGVADLADAPAERPATRHLHRHVETLVVGGGRTGVEAATEAASRGDRVVLVHDRHIRPDGAPSGEDVTVLVDATALGVYDDGYVVVHERPAERVWHVRAARVVLATGAFERPIAFVGNDLPGAVLASAAAHAVQRHGVLPGERIVVFTTNDWGAAAGEVLREAGAEVETVDARAGDRVVAARGGDRLREVKIVRADGGRESLGADLLAVSGGWNPNLALWRSIGGGLRYDGERACFVPDDGGPPWLSTVGAAAGEVPTCEPVWTVADGDDAAKYVDLQRDQTVADVRETLDRGLRSVEHVKRATYIGTAIDQGRTGGVVVAEIVNALLGDAPGAQGPTTARPPAVPVSFAALAGPFRGDLLDPVRTTPIHAWHVEHGAAFEDVGQWKRPWYFPQAGESMREAVTRECLAVRTAAGAMDASTLGKIEVVGADAPTFLDRMYTNRMSNLAVGSIRYGLMLGPDGMVVDDGVAMRLAEDRYLVTTTTSGAAMVLDRFEEWLQTEWPELRVSCTSVTEQWAVVAVNGPTAREVVAAIGTDVDLSPAAFPFMTFRDGIVAGVPARLARVSFSGELAYELHVSGWHGRHVWEAVMAGGAIPYGTEAMHVLRAEKGYVIVGQDT
ncbi:MAG TPA: 2Fe-2S iron-sulfur cluster-binding protein, partial [Actinomycetota bacterium]|nr:2Fe-2S iron-sulfur cluster-binding protein [Actinomycetota bacterium]